MGQKTTSRKVHAMSDLLSTADIALSSLNVCLVPEADIIKSGNRPRNDAPQHPYVSRLA